MPAIGRRRALEQRDEDDAMTTPMTITMVKKIQVDGSPCSKCDDVLARIERDGVGHRIDRVVIADEREADSEGGRIAAHHGVERAPFFVVERPGEPAQVYTIYLRLLREVLQKETDERAEAAELMHSAGLDFI